MPTQAAAAFSGITAPPDAPTAASSPSPPHELHALVSQLGCDRWALAKVAQLALQQLALELGSGPREYQATRLGAGGSGQPSDSGYGASECGGGKRKLYKSADDAGGDEAALWQQVQEMEACLSAVVQMELEASKQAGSLAELMIAMDDKVEAIEAAAAEQAVKIEQVVHLLDSSENP